VTYIKNTDDTSQKALQRLQDTMTAFQKLQQTLSNEGQIIVNSLRGCAALSAGAIKTICADELLLRNKLIEAKVSYYIIVFEYY
jgi:hypothetical protein